MRGEAGGVALLLASAAFVLFAAGLALLSVVTDLGTATARARTAADAAALAASSAARFAVAGTDPCAAARQVAEANGASLRACDTDRHRLVDGLAYPAAEVEVEVTPANPMTRSITGAIPARAAAALHKPP